MKLNSTDALSLGAIAFGALTAATLSVAALGAHPGHHHHPHGAERVHLETPNGLDAESPVRHAPRVWYEDRSEDASKPGVVQLDGTVTVRTRGDHGSAGPDPLIYVDGIRVAGDRDEVLATIYPALIDRVEIVKGDAAIRLFGEEAVGGVIQIYLKDEVEAANPGR